MPFRLNGFGTAFCGQCDFRFDGSFIATEWITAAYVPIIPLRSFHLVRAASRNENLVFYRSEGYNILEKLPVLWPQVFRIYAFMGCAITWWIFLIWLFLFNFAFMSGSNVSAMMLLMLLFVCLMGMPLIAVVWPFRRNSASNQNRKARFPHS
jgi:hypothetical protein